MQRRKTPAEFETGHWSTACEIGGDIQAFRVEAGD